MLKCIRFHSDGFCIFLFVVQIIIEIKIIFYFIQWFLEIFLMCQTRIKK